jgi:hypothetical protein
MHNFWDSAVLPLLEALEPTRIVEVGVARGDQTRKLLGWAAAHGATVHGIDPEPAFEVHAEAPTLAGSFVLHRELSLSALPAVAPAGVILLDGDHNWYTMFNELRAIERSHAEWPPVLAHDVDWPYGRRDMYYAPSAIPPAHRHPHRRAGMRRFHSALIDGGKNSTFCNAEHEGGPRNGVLTAIEDFLAATALDLRLLAQPGPAGLGVIVSAAELTRRPRLAAALARIHDPEYAISLSPVHAAREWEVAAESETPRLADVCRRAKSQPGHATSRHARPSVLVIERDGRCGQCSNLS